MIFALALLFSAVDAKQRTAPTISAENSKGMAPRAFEPKDVLIETPRQGKSGGL